MNQNDSGLGLLKEECSSAATSGSGWTRACDSCCSAPCTVYCRADDAYLCTGCDARVQAANRFASRHERVWVCEACEQAPAVFTCQADAAALCATCDADVHSVNQLASRHHRVPVLPLPAGGLPSSCVISNPFLAVDDGVEEDQDEAAVDLNANDEVSSWLLFDSKDDNRNDDGLFFSKEMDEHLNLVEYESCNDQTQSDDQEHKQQQQQQQQKLQMKHEKNEVSECVVPSHSVTVDNQQSQQQGSYGLMNIDYNDVPNTGFSYVHPLCHSVSLPSMDASIVPDNTMTDLPNSHLTTPKGAIDLFLSLSLKLMPQPVHLDRKAKVLRYREKKKMRKFEKTIRYASRKAYAETRPRIKGRFAKRTDRELEVDQIFSSSVLSEGSCGVVPSF